MAPHGEVPIAKADERVDPVQQRSAQAVGLYPPSVGVGDLITEPDVR
jgi:hypothetical protein